MHSSKYPSSQTPTNRQMASKHHLSSLFFILLITTTTTSTSSFSSSSSLTLLPPPPPSSNSTQFIRKSCSSTLYPALCVHSLLQYSDSIKLDDPVNLACVATNISLVSLHSLSSHVSSLIRAASPSTARSYAALRDCRDSLGDAGDQIRRSAGEIERLEASVPVGPEIAWRVSNAQTWMSAALTNQDTCADGFAGVGPGNPVKMDVCPRVWRAKKFTSNALALINALVAGGH